MKKIMDELESQAIAVREAKELIEAYQSEAEEQKTALIADKEALDRRIEEANNYINNLYYVVSDSENRRKELEKPKRKSTPR